MHDHRKLGRELELFDTDPLIGAGLPYWLPAGAAIRHALEEYIREVERRAGYQHVYSPVLGKRELYEISGHWSHYRDGMYCRRPRRSPGKRSGRGCGPWSPGRNPAAWARGSRPIGWCRTRRWSAPARRPRARRRCDCEMVGRFRQGRSARCWPASASASLSTAPSCGKRPLCPFSRRGGPDREVGGLDGGVHHGQQVGPHGVEGSALLQPRSAQGRRRIDRRATAV